MEKLESITFPSFSCQSDAKSYCMGIGDIVAHKCQSNPNDKWKYCRILFIHFEYNYYDEKLISSVIHNNNTHIPVT